MEAAPDPSGPVLPSDDPAHVSRSGPLTIETFRLRGGEVVQFYASNVSPDIIDLTLTFELVNMRASGVGLPRTLLPPSRVRLLVATLERARSTEPFSYTFSYAMHFGDPNAKPRGSYVPPVATGSGFVVANAFFGFGAHEKLTPHAVDIPLPEGTQVHAARTGIVVRVKADSDRGGPDVKFAADANYVIVRHEDGTYGSYVHLKKDGVLVRPGQLVLAGMVLGLSGNTGWSTGPHLHFHVAVADGKGDFATVPWTFSVGGREVTPTKGMKL